ncbi:MAG: aminoacyl-tRNA hydrolase [Planctomycetota bacterium]|jgi:PTH1 family peptidyl-tRNA hydrolase
MADFKIIVGLGNPGEEYADTRHNIGFRVIDALAKDLDVKLKKRKFGALFGQAEFENKKLILLKPQSFMNRSGHVVATAAGFYQLPHEDLLVVFDDMALDVGRLRMRAKGSAGGHNGLADIIDKLGTEEFSRLRIGIGSDFQESSVDFVLDVPDEDEQTILDKAIEIAKDAVFHWISFGIESAMNKFNAADEMEKEE